MSRYRTFICGPSDCPNDEHFEHDDYFGCVPKDFSPGSGRSRKYRQAEASGPLVLEWRLRRSSPTRRTPRACVVTPRQLSLLNQPRATRSRTSRVAAEAVTPAAGLLELRIVEAATSRTAEQIAHVICGLEPGRWTHGTVLTAISRAERRGLLIADGEGVTSRNRPARLYRKAGGA